MSEVRMETVSFMHQSSILFAWDQWWKTFLSSVVEAETSSSQYNSAMDFFWVVKLLETSSTAWWPAVDSFELFSFKYCSMALSLILRDSSLLISLFLYVTSEVGIYYADLHHCILSDAIISFSDIILHKYSPYVLLRLTMRWKRRKNCYISKMQQITCTLSAVKHWSIHLIPK